jgi:hypothetical protein
MLTGYIVILVQVLVYMMIRIRLGFRLTYHEKNQLLEGFLKLGQKFIEDYNNEAAQLGTTRVDVPSRGDLCVSQVPFSQDETQIPRLL